MVYLVGIDVEVFDEYLSFLMSRSDILAGVHLSSLCFATPHPLNTQSVVFQHVGSGRIIIWKMHRYVLLVVTVEGIIV